MEEALSELGRVQETIEAQDLWELDRTVERAMQQLRCPPPEVCTAATTTTTAPPHHHTGHHIPHRTRHTPHTIAIAAAIALHDLRYNR